MNKDRKLSLNINNLQPLSAKNIVILLTILQYDIRQQKAVASRNQRLLLWGYILPNTLDGSRDNILNSKLRFHLSSIGVLYHRIADIKGMAS